MKVGLFHTGGYQSENIELNSLEDLIALVEKKNCQIIVHTKSYKDYLLEMYEDDEVRLKFLKENDLFIEVYDDYRE